jgi:adenosylmethionine-8-amino-7-oxononanoate aminotransferase
MSYNKVWYPYSQMLLNEPRFKVSYAKDEFITLEDGSVLIDGVSSWWAAIHGYNNNELNKALSEQADKFAHVMLGGLTHNPVERFAEKLIDISPKELNHVFFSDSGSVAIEVALKMAIQYWSNKREKTKCKFISLKDAYHGDTFKAMEIGDDSDYQASYNHVLSKGFYVSIPKGGFSPKEKDLNDAIREFESVLEINSHQIAAFIVEPIMQGAGGFKLYSPEYLKAVKKLCKKHNVLFIADEVATGFGRTGKFFACDYAEISPDIMVLGKALTAGYLGHAATLATTDVYNSFLGETYEEAFMHGPTFMGNPLACAVGLKSLEIFERENYLSKVREIEAIFYDSFSNFIHTDVVEIRIIGCMIAIETKNADCLQGFKKYAISKGLWLRPIDKYVYATPPFIISKTSLAKIISGLKGWFLK